MSVLEILLTAVVSGATFGFVSSRIESRKIVRLKESLHACHMALGVVDNPRGPATFSEASHLARRIWETRETR